MMSCAGKGARKRDAAEGLSLTGRGMACKTCSGRILWAFAFCSRLQKSL